MRCQPEPPSRHRLSPAADGAQALGASLAVDLLSWGSELASRRRRSADETAEIVRRRWQAGLYLLRTPLFELGIQAALLKVGAGLGRLPRWSGGALPEPAPALSKDDVDGGRVGAGPLIGAAYSWVVELLCYCVTEYYFVRERAFRCIASFHCARAQADNSGVGHSTPPAHDKRLSANKWLSLDLVIGTRSAGTRSAAAHQRHVLWRPGASASHDTSSIERPLDSSNGCLAC